MANVSKNIKRLRAAQKLTQEQLAGALNVTRQTVSSWENDRTQPDIDMLAALAAALHTDIEDLIYGKKKHVGLEADPAEKRRTLSLVLVIAGSLLFAVGLIFLFVYFWNEIPGLMKTLLSFLPMAVGMGAGLAVLFTGRKSVPFKEGAAVLWFAGFISSNALINSLFSVDFGFDRLLLADALLLLPVAFLLDSVFAYTAETALALTLLSRPMFDDSLTWYFFAGLAVFAANAAFVFKNGQPGPAKQFCAWLALLGAGAAATAGGWLLCDVTDAPNSFYPIWTIPFLFFTALYIAGRGRRFSLQLRFPAAAALISALPVLTAFAFIEDLGEVLPLGAAGTVYALLWAAACFGFAFFRKRGQAEKTAPVQKGLAAVLIAFCAMLLLLGLPKAATLLFSVAAGVLTVIAGVQRSRLLLCNLGMAQLAANVVILLVGLHDLDIFWIGLLFLVIGAVFLVTNKIMSKKFEARKAAQAAAAGADEETEGTDHA